jgi:hypothetical protein
VNQTWINLDKCAMVVWGIHIPSVQHYFRVVRNEDTVVLKRAV